MSAIESAPATIPATSPVIFTGAFAPAVPATVTRCPTRSARLHRYANSSTGTRPAHDTKFGSSNDADSAEGA
jgi:hypothetical protein